MHQGIPVPAMLARVIPLCRNQPFECQPMPRSSDQLTRRAEDHPVEDRAQMPLQPEEETEIHRLSHRAPPHEAVREGPGGHQKILLQVAIQPEMRIVRKRKRRRNDAHPRGLQIRLTHAERLGK